jgi:hypothetical protein
VIRFSLTKFQAHGQQKVHCLAVPTRVRADFVVVHAQVALAFLKQLLNGPAHPGGFQEMAIKLGQHK